MASRLTRYVAVDQYGQTVFLKKHPRKELLDHFGMKHADKMFRDTVTGHERHVGYVIGGHWLTVLGLQGVVFGSVL